MKDKANKRDFSRVPVTITAEVRSGDRTVRGSVEDMSVSGLFLACRDPFPPGTECEVLVTLGEGDGVARIEAQGAVVRSDAEGMALALSGTDPDSLTYLRNLVRYNARNVPQVEEELDQSVGIKRRH